MILALAISTTVLAQSVLREVEKKFTPPPRFDQGAVYKPVKYQHRKQPLMLDEILASPVIQKALIKGGNIQEIQTGSVQGITQRMYVNVHQKSDEHGFFYIVDKSGNVSKRVHLKHTVSIEAEVEMYEPPRLFTEVLERKNVSPYDHNFLWRPEFLLNLNRGQSYWTADILDEARATGSSGYQLGGRFMMDMSSRFQIGLSVFFESSNHTFDGGSASYKNLSFGILGKTPQIEWGGFPWRLFIDGRFGPTGTLQVTRGSSQDELETRSTILQLGWERIHQNRWGEFLWGFSFQRDWPKLRNQKNYIAQDSTDATNDLFGLHIAQGLPW